MSRSTTRLRLHQLRAALLGVTLLALLSSWYAFDDVHDTIATVRNDTAPALLEAASARSALAEADALAISSFRTGEAQLTGPGDRYQNRIAMATQSLAQVAENNTAGETTSRQLHLVAGLVVAYTGWIEQADAHYRQGAVALATTDLWHASRLLHTQILVQLDQVLAAQEKALAAQLQDSTTSFRRFVVVWLPIVVLVLLLGFVLWFLSRRFNRTVNLPLALAILVVAGLAWVTALGPQAQSRAENAAAELRQVAMDWENRTTAIRVQGQTQLKDLVTAQCPGDCGDTVARFVADLGAASTVSVTEQQLTGKAKAVNASIIAADGRAELEAAVPVLAGLVIVLVLLGFRPRIEEYGFRER